MSRRLPRAAETDVLIVGGASGGVACALAAAKAGRSVWLIAPRSYVGDDIAADFDYWPHADDQFTTDLARSVFPRGANPNATPPTPMHVKSTLEQALVDAGVTFVFNCHPAGLLRDADGRIAGVVIANRNGRQVIAAGVVVDATQRGLVARQAGAAFTPSPAGEQAVSHVTVGGETMNDPAFRAEPLPPMVHQHKKGPIELPARRYTLTVDLGDGSWRAAARAYAEVADRCWTPGVWLHSERLGLAWPDRLAGEPLLRQWVDAESFDLDALAVEPGLWVLGGAAKVGPEAAPGLLRPAHAMAVGERLGAGLAGEVATRVGELSYQNAASESLPTGEIRSLDDGLRPGGQDQPTLELDVDRLPRLGRFDVVVVGGGTGGASAGIAAMRAGAATLVCEAGPALGGVGTLGQICKYYYGNITGFTCEIDAGVDELEVDDRFTGKPAWTPAAKQAWYLRQLHRGRADVWFGVNCCGTWTEGDRVRGVIVAGPGGFGLVEAGAVVDATGNADVAAAAGAPTTGIAADHVAVQGTGLAGLAPDLPYNNTDHSFSDDTDLVDATAFHVTSRRKFGSFFDAGQLVDSRERRQIIGEIELGPVDFLCDRTFPDTVCRHSSNFDTHGFTVHPLFMVKPPDKQRMWVNVPLRCLIPQRIERVLVTGLGVSAHRDAIPVIRMQPDVQNQGYAAGRAAAMAAVADVDVRQIDISDLQRHLVEVGNLEPGVLSDEDSFPVPDAKLRWAVDEGWDDHLGIGLCLAEPQRTRPLLREAYDTAGDRERRLRYAHVLALMGDNHGVATLHAAVADRPWDAGWNYRGMGQFGMSLSEVDALLIALGRVGGEGAWPVVLTRIAELGDDPDFSHCRAVAEACEALHDRHPNDEAATALAALLERPGMAGHAQTTIAEAQAQLTDDRNETAARNRALRELHLARALYRCGDAGDRGAATLRRYADDLRGHFARHARAVLGESARSVAVRR